MLYRSLIEIGSSKEDYSTSSLFSCLHVDNCVRFLRNWCKVCAEELLGLHVGTLITVTSIVLELHPGGTFLANGDKRRKLFTGSSVQLDRNASKFNRNVTLFRRSHGWWRRGRRSRLRSDCSGVGGGVAEELEEG